MLFARSPLVVMIISAALLASCGDPQTQVTASGEPGTAAEPSRTLLDGDELLEEPLRLPDEVERVIDVNEAVDGVAFLQRRWNDETCMGLRFPDVGNPWVDVCKPPENWDSFSTIYATDPTGTRHFVLGAVSAEVSEVHLHFGDQVVVTSTVESMHTSLVRFFAAEVPDVWQTRVQGFDDSELILDIDYPAAPDEAHRSG